MSRRLFLFALALLLSFPGLLSAREDDGPDINIVSPDAGTTFAYASILHRSLIWDPKTKMLFARVTFVDAREPSGSAPQDQHEFHFPGVTFDEAKGIFYATSPKGRVIPVAHIQKVLFVKHIEPLPNARVRIIYPRGECAAILEAIPPESPAMHPKPDLGNGDGTHKININ